MPRRGYPPAPPDIATGARYNPSVAFAMMFRWISLDPA